MAYRPPGAAPIAVPPDDQLIAWINRARWHRSRGYTRGDGAEIGAHEYIVRREEPDLFLVLRERVLHGADGYWGTYKGYRHHYLHLAGWKYWATFSTILNRERLPEGV